MDWLTLPTDQEFPLKLSTYYKETNLKCVAVPSAFRRRPVHLAALLKSKRAVHESYR